MMQPMFESPRTETQEETVAHIRLYSDAEAACDVCCKVCGCCINCENPVEPLCPVWPKRQSSNPYN